MNFQFNAFKSFKNYNISIIYLTLVTFIFYFLLYYKNPFVITIIVILSTLLLGASFITIRMSWFFYSIVVIFLGGMIVVFLYASSLRTLFKLERNFGFNSFQIMFSALTVCFILINSTYNSNKEPLFTFFRGNQFILIYLVLFLLVVLLLVVKLSSRDTGPLKL